MERLLSPKEAAERMGVSVSLIYSWCEERRLAHYRVGGKGRRGKIMISPRDLDSFVESLRVEVTGKPSR
jgi:excisionase family DNA binding protein